MGTTNRMKIQMFVLLAFVFLTGAEKRTHDYFIDKGYKYDNIAVQKTVTAQSLQECIEQCLIKDTVCRYANYNMTSKLCSIGDIPCIPVLSAIATNTAISRSKPYEKPDKAYSCLDIQKQRLSKGSGVYTIYVPTADNPSTTKLKEVYCDMETDCGGWLVFQRRTDGSENFYRGWDDYQNGFGDKNNEFWLGNGDLYQLLKTAACGNELRIELEDFEDETRFAKYSTFSIASGVDNYRLTIGGYTGDKGDAMAYHNGSPFTTKDRDNDAWLAVNCAQVSYGAWWYKDCRYANLNGRYLNGDSQSQEGINWHPWKNDFYSLKFTEMKIRPKQ